MKKMNKKTLVIIGGGILTVGVGYLIYNLFKTKPTSFNEAIEDTNSEVLNIVNNVTGSVYKEQGFPLKKFSGGEDVKKLQRYLNDVGSYGLTVDGKFGAKTENAVITEQEPFETFKSMYPNAVKGQVAKEFFDEYVASY
jgi:hypothetical protein